jgi:5'-3' exoribonuclease 1
LTQEKLHFSARDEEALTAMAENYVQGLQWVLLYYYRGVPSWEWFYHYHYSTKITGLCLKAVLTKISKGVSKLI